VLTEPNLQGRGWRFPVLPDSRGRLGWSTGEQDVEEAIYLVLTTSVGERPMLPEFGCRARDYLFSGASDLTRAAVAESVRNALVRWEPRIVVQDVDVEVDDGRPNLLLIRVGYILKRTNAVHSLVLPYYVDEAGV
jgi:phage baseplate assembly protein W